MAVSEFDEKIQRLADFQAAQGVFLDRLEKVVAENSDAIKHNSGTITRNSELITRNSEAIRHLSNAVQSMHDNMQVMQDAMHALFERMDRFIRGLEGNGHGRSKGKE